MSPHPTRRPPLPSIQVLPQGAKYPPETDLREWSLQVKGNASLEVKRGCLLLKHIFVLTPEKSFAANVGRRLRLVEVNIWDGPGKGREYSHPTDDDKEGSEVAETIFEITVEEEMVNSVGVLHGGCAAYIIDPCSASSILALGMVKGKLSEYAGLSQAMNIIWHQPIKLGTKIRIISISMAVNGKIKTARCEIWNGDILCISATHSMANPGKGPILKEGILVKL